jgi:hypothetical protein
MARDGACFAPSTTRRENLRSSIVFFFVIIVFP